MTDNLSEPQLPHPGKGDNQGSPRSRSEVVVEGRRLELTCSSTVTGSSQKQAPRILLQGCGLRHLVTNPSPSGLGWESKIWVRVKIGKVRGLGSGGCESLGKEFTERGKQNVDRREAAGSGRRGRWRARRAEVGWEPLTSSPLSQPG